MSVTPAEGRTEQILESMADGYASSSRSPILHTPAEHGLAYENVTFGSEDGVPLEGWFVPAPGSRRVVVVNHPRWFSRSGLPSHREPWRSAGAAHGNDFEVDLTPDIRILHDAGYHVLAYDLRNFGHSGTGNGGFTTGGVYESRDVVGSLRWVRDRPELRGAAIGLFSRCLGANGTLFAMSRRPEEFDDVRCLVACQPLSPRMVMERALEAQGLPAALADDLSERIRLRISFRLDDMSPIPAAKDVRVPTFVYQVRDDTMTRPRDVQAVYDALPLADRELHWIEGTTRRWDGYTWFQREPARVLGWLDAHMG